MPLWVNILIGKVIFLLILWFSGVSEVEVLERKLKEAKIPNLEFMKIRFDSIFNRPRGTVNTNFRDLVEDISSWPSVITYVIDYNYLKQYILAGWNRIPTSKSDNTFQS